MAEPAATAYLLLAAGLLLLVSAVLSRATARLGVPVALAFLAIGMVSGAEHAVRVSDDDYRLAFRLGTIALVLILFDGGLHTPVDTLKRVLAPAAVLATAGVVATAGITAAGARLAGLPWVAALLLGAVVSSTDAAAVFSVLRAGSVRVMRRVGDLIELESGLNDPMAVILTLAVTALAGGTRRSPAELAIDVAVQLAVGGLVGLGVGVGGRELLARMRPLVAGLFPVATLSIAFLTFALATVLGGSGFLAAYVTGIVLGAARLPYQSGISHVHDAIAWFAQVAMFLVLGSLVAPSRLLDAAGVGIAVALTLALVARPLAVAACLAPFRLPAREIAFVGWAGLRGAVPIVLATIPVMSRVPGSERLLDVVFFVVVVNAFLPGATLRAVTRRLGVESDEAPPPRAVLEITTSQRLDRDVLAFHVSAASAVAGATLAELPLPPGALVMLVVRGAELIAPRGGTSLLPGDHVYVLCRPEEQPEVKLMFGQLEEA
jgi:cell volume regulation protein A